MTTNITITSLRILTGAGTTNSLVKVLNWLSDRITTTSNCPIILSTGIWAGGCQNTLNIPTGVPFVVSTRVVMLSTRSPIGFDKIGTTEMYKKKLCYVTTCLISYNHHSNITYSWHVNYFSFIIEYWQTLLETNLLSDRTANLVYSQNNLNSFDKKKKKTWYPF